MTAYIGATLSVVASVPATEDAAGYGLLTFVEIAKVISVGQIGDTHEDLSDTLLKTGRTDHLNGAVDGGEVEVVLEYDPADADPGYAIIDAGNGTNTQHSFELVDPDSETHYFQGVIANLKHRERTASTRKGATFTIRVNSGIVTA